MNCFSLESLSSRLLLPLILAAAPMSARAAQLATYPFTGASPAPTGILAGVTAGNFQFNNTTAESTNTSFADVGFSSGNNAFVRTTATGSTQANALADDDYLFFTLSATSPNTRLNLSTLTFDFGGADATGTAYTNSIFVQSSVGGFGTAGSVLFTANSNIAANASPTTLQAAGTTVDLSGAAFQNIQSITFQFRFSDSVNNDNQTDRLDNVTLNGTVVPEPSTYLLSAFAAALAIGLKFARRLRAVWTGCVR